MRPRDSLDDMWSVVSADELSDDWLNAAGDNDDDMTTAAADDVHRRQDDLPAQPSTTTTTKTKSVRTKATRSVVRRNERERNRVKQVNDLIAKTHVYMSHDTSLIECENDSELRKKHCYLVTIFNMSKSRWQNDVTVKI